MRTRFPGLAAKLPMFADGGVADAGFDSDYQAWVQDPDSGEWLKPDELARRRAAKLAGSGAPMAASQTSGAVTHNPAPVAPPPAPMPSGPDMSYLDKYTGVVDTKALPQFVVDALNGKQPNALDKVSTAIGDKLAEGYNAATGWDPGHVKEKVVAPVTQFVGHDIAQMRGLPNGMAGYGLGDVQGPQIGEPGGQAIAKMVVPQNAVDAALLAASLLGKAKEALPLLRGLTPAADLTGAGYRAGIGAGGDLEAALKASLDRAAAEKAAPAAAAKVVTPLDEAAQQRLAAVFADPSAKVAQLRRSLAAEGISYPAGASREDLANAVLERANLPKMAPLEGGLKPDVPAAAVESPVQSPASAMDRINAMQANHIETPPPSAGPLETQGGEGFATQREAVTGEPSGPNGESMGPVNNPPPPGEPLYNAPAEAPAPSPPDALVEQAKSLLRSTTAGMPDTPGMPGAKGGLQSWLNTNGDYTPYQRNLIQVEGNLQQNLINSANEALKPQRAEVAALFNPEKGMDAKVVAGAWKQRVDATFQDVFNRRAQFRDEALDERYGAGTKARNDAAVALEKRDLALKAQGKGPLAAIIKAQNAAKEAELSLDFAATFQHYLKFARTGSAGLVESGIGHLAQGLGGIIGKPLSPIYDNPALSVKQMKALLGLGESTQSVLGLGEKEINSGGGSYLSNVFSLDGERGLTSAVKAIPRALGEAGKASTAVQYGILSKLADQAFEGQVYAMRLLGRDTSFLSPEGLKNLKVAADYARMSRSTAYTAANPTRALAENLGILTAKANRSQIAELANPLKTGRSVADTISTVNQIASLAGMAGAGYAANQQFGVKKSFEQFAKESLANPLSSGWGKITLKARDADGNRIVFNFVPQNSYGHSIARGLNAALQSAEGNQSAAQGLGQIGDTFARLAAARANIFPNDAAHILGLGYDSTGNFHDTSRMSPAESVKSSLPLPLSFTGAIFDPSKRDPNSLALNFLGANTYGESDRSALNSTAQQQFGAGFDKLHATDQAQLIRQRLDSGETIPFKTRDTAWWTARNDALATWKQDLAPDDRADPMAQEALKVGKYGDISTTLTKWAEDTYGLSKRDAEAAVAKFQSSTHLDDYIVAYRKEVLDADPGLIDAWDKAYTAGETTYTPPGKWARDHLKDGK